MKEAFFLKQQYSVGIDMGTTSTKAVLFRQNGEVVDAAYVAYPLLKETPSMAEQDLEDLFEAVVVSIRMLMDKTAVEPKEILCVSFASAMHSLIAMDYADQPLTRSITWADNRSAKWANQLKAANGMEIYHRTGTPIHPMSPLAKIIWLREEQPTTFSQTKKFIGIKEYIFYQLFGHYIVDYSIASSTGLFNIHHFKWDEAALAVAGILEDQLSVLASPTDKLVGLPQKYADQMGLLPETPFVLGGNDGCLSNLGVGAVEPGVAAITIGTSGAVRMVTDQPYTDPKGRTFCYVLDEQHWVIGGAVNNGGVVLNWASQNYFPMEQQLISQTGDNAYDYIMEQIAAVPAGANGLFFHPYLNGERAPLWDAEARGSFFGINMLHQPQHFLRAVLEGICFNLYDVFCTLTELAGEPKKIIATGGFSQSLVWRQMLTDIFGRPFTLPESFESSCLGAAVMGLKSMGILQEVSEVANLIGTEHQHIPQAAEARMYAKLFPIYRQLSQTFSGVYHQVAELQENLDELKG